MLPEHGFLFKQANIRQRNGFLPKGPSILINALKRIESTVAQQLAYGNMHEVHFLFLAEIFLGQSAQFPNANQKQDGIQIGLLAELLLQPGYHLIPAFAGFLFHKRESKTQQPIPGPVLIFS